MALATRNSMTEEREDPRPPLSEQLSNSLQGKDEPMEKNHPMAPAALVFLTYPMMLTIAAIVTVGALWFFGVLGGAGSTTPAVPTPPVETQTETPAAPPLKQDPIPR